MLHASPWPLSVVLLGISGFAHAEPPEAMERARNSYALAQRGDLEAASEEMRAAIRLAPENPLYLSALGGIAARQGRADESKKCFERAVQLDPRNPVLRFQLAKQQWDTGELVPARENIAVAADAQPANSDVQRVLEEISLELGADFARQRRLQAGLLLAQDTARRFPDSARAQQMLGLFASRNQLNSLAVTVYARALAISPDAPDLSVSLGIAQTMAGLFSDAVKTFENGIRKWPRDPMHHQAYGVLLLRMAEAGSGSEQQGVDILRKALELDPSLAEAHYQLGNVALTRGDTEAAIRHLLAAHGYGGGNSKTLFALSRAYRAAGQQPEADQYGLLFRQQKEREQRAPSAK